MTLDETLALFKKELAKDKEELDGMDLRAIELSNLCLSNPLLFDRELYILRIRRITVEERIKCYENSIRRLCEEMADAYL